MKYSELRPGLFFTYRRRFLFFQSRTAGLEQVVGMDEDKGVVHVRVFWTPGDVDEAEGANLVAVGHLPILLSQFMASRPEPLETHAVPPDSRPSVMNWRGRHMKGEVGAFSVPLWNAVKLAWETAIESRSCAPDKIYIEAAYPKVDSTGGFTVVEVSAYLRAPASAAGDGEDSDSR